ncbi:MAG: hypothetical protein R3F50_17415 [Gammaproteobacteria bacterium]|jgi:hypothetical protein
MMERLYYYIDLAITLCGFDGSEGSTVLGWVVIGIATVLVIYAFYKGALGMLDPGERDESHIKYRVLCDESIDGYDRKERPHAY